MGRINDWSIEHKEVVGLALENGIDNFPDLWKFALEHMNAVSEDYLRELWGEKHSHQT